MYFSFILLYCIVVFSLFTHSLFCWFSFPKTAQPKRIVPRLASVASQVESLFHSYQHTNAQQKQHYSQHNNNTIYQLVTQDNHFRHRDVVSSSNWKRLSFSGFESCVPTGHKRPWRPSHRMPCRGRRDAAPTREKRTESMNERTTVGAMNDRSFVYICMSYYECTIMHCVRIGSRRVCKCCRQLQDVARLRCRSQHLVLPHQYRPQLVIAAIGIKVSSWS